MMYKLLLYAVKGLLLSCMEQPGLLLMMYQLPLHAVKGLLLSWSNRSSLNGVSTTTAQCQRFVIELEQP